ncbi:MAG: ACP S-malonyltransferase [Candidatus Omnitrophica bacterium]|nr:ACP S-malonyltransferase [Candidatus Omnitrophota bacterium]
MGKDLAKTFPGAKDLFQRSDDLLGFSLSEVCFEGPLEKLTRTDICQPALYVASLAALEALKSSVPQGISPAAAAGLSLGEYTALAAAGALSFEDGLRLVHLRGQAMEEAAHLATGTMASVLGLELEILEPICAQTGAEVANINAPGQIVISGSPEAVEAASAKAKEKGSKRVVPLEVGGAFHSRLMEPAAAQLKKALEGVALQPLKFPVASNVTGAYYTGSDQVPRLLVEQLTSPVRWEACVRTLVQAGVRTFLEVGPGTVLKGLCRRIDPEVPVHSAGTADQVRELAAQWA